MIIPYRYVVPIRFAGEEPTDYLAFYPVFPLVVPQGEELRVTILRPGGGSPKMFIASMDEYRLKGSALWEAYSGWHIDHLDRDRDFVEHVTKEDGLSDLREAVEEAIKMVEAIPKADPALATDYTSAPLEEFRSNPDHPNFGG